MRRIIEETISEKVKRMEGCQKNRYCKADIEGELRKLQQEILKLVFDEEHIMNANLRIWDAYNQLERENREKGGIATSELKNLREGCKTFNNMIRAEISGNWGENQVFNRLGGLRGKNVILRNVELSDRENRTELDFIVLTEKVQVIVEVKNTKKDVFIDETGAFYRKGEYMSFDCNIKFKMENREKLLAKVIAETLADRGKSVNIVKLVVFTNNRIEIRNKCEELKICFLGELPYYIDEYVGEKLYSEEDISALAEIISDSEELNKYELEMDIHQFKNNFVKVLAILENTEGLVEMREKAMEEKVDMEIPEFLSENGCLNQKRCTKIFYTLVGGATVVGIGNVIYKMAQKRSR